MGSISFIKEDNCSCSVGQRFIAIVAVAAVIAVFITTPAIVVIAAIIEPT